MKTINQLYKLIIAGIATVMSLYSLNTYAAVGGGATIHNAATLTFNGGVVTATVDVTVDTVAAAPTITVTPVAVSANPGDSVTLTYTITSNASGSDSYSLTPTSVDTGVNGAPTALSLSTGSVTLGASITSAPSVGIDTDTGTIFIPAGSETDITAGDVIVINGFSYTVDAVRAGTPTTTVGNTTTPETPTEVDLTIIGAAPPVGAGTIASGVQIGEQQTFTADVTTNTPTVSGVNGSHVINVNGNTSALTAGAAGAVVNFSTNAGDGNEATITVLSANVTLTKEVRNVTEGTPFSTSDNAQSGDELEYRITATPVAGSGNATSSVLVDEIPDFTTYVTDSTTLNGTAITDDAAPNEFPLSSANSGLEVSSPGATPGEIVDGQEAVILYRVTVD